MGKNKRKTSNVFKVAGVKNLKFKAKAKAVKTDLKNISVKNKNKVREMDKALAQLEDKIRQTNRPIEKPTETKTSKLPAVDNAESLETQKKSEEAIKDLDSMQL